MTPSLFAPLSDRGRSAADPLAFTTAAVTSIIGTEGDDSLNGTTGDDLMEGLGGNDILWSNNGKDTLLGGAGNDTLIGGDRGGLTDGGDGDDVLQPRVGDHTVKGGRGDDRIYITTNGNYNVDGGEGNDLINLTFVTDGSKLNTSVIHGGDGDDKLWLSASSPSLSNVIAYGDAGRDYFLLGDSSDRISIADFAVGAGGDVLDVNIFNRRQDNPFGKAGILRLYQNGADTLLQYDPDGAAGTLYGFKTILTLTGVNAASLTSANIAGNIDPTGVIENPTWTGTAGDDTITGGRRDDVIYGLGGRDVLHGMDGSDYIEGGDEEGAGDSIDGAYGYDTLIGGAGDDVLDGEQGNDSLDGGSGNDTLQGGSDNDMLFGGTGNDDLNGDNGHDTLDGGDGDDILRDVDPEGGDYFFGGDNVLRGGAGNDRLSVGGTGNDLLDGGSGNDTLTASAGRDTLDGGSGDDLIRLSLVDYAVADTTALGGDGDDRFEFQWQISYGSYQLTGGSGRDTYAMLYPSVQGTVVVTDFQPGAGGDVIDVSFEQNEPGNPFGSAGYLRLVQNGADTLFQFDADGAAGDFHTFRTLMTLKGVQASQIGAHNIAFGFDPDGSPITPVLTGTSGNDKLSGSPVADIISGGAGHDTLAGNSGDDVLRGDDGNDAIDGGSGNDRLDGGAGDDTLAGGYGNDELLGGAGNDSLTDTGGGSDRLYGGDGDDTLSADYGADYLSGGNGNDAITARYGNHDVDAGAGNDSVAAMNGNMQINGGAGDDTLSLKGYGDSGLFGGNGRDVLRIVFDYEAKGGRVVANGGAGDDLIEVVRDSGDTALTAIGGAGADTYRLSGAERLGSLTIKDFAVGAGGDRIDLSGLFSAAMRAGDPYAAGVLLLVKDGSSTVIALDRDGKAGPDTGYVLATVENVTAESLKDSIVWMDAPAGAAAPLALVGQAPDAFALG